MSADKRPSSELNFARTIQFFTQPFSTRSNSQSEGVGELRRWIAPTAGCLLALLIFYREFFLSGFDRVAGDIGDNRFILVILEHWRNVFAGRAALASPNFFAPEPGVLGFSESLFLLAVPHALFRLIGLDRFLSLQLTFLLIKAIGFTSMYVLLSRYIRLDGWVAVLGAFLFSVSNVDYLAAGHGQLTVTALVPFVAVLICRSWTKQARNDNSGARLSLTAASVLLALILFTSFYIGWFAMLTSGFLLITAVGVSVAVHRGFSQVRGWIALLMSNKSSLVVAAVAFLLAFMPFLYVYMDKLKQTGGRQYSEALYYMPEPIDGVNVGKNNVVWGNLIQSRLGYLASRPGAHEKVKGWPWMAAGALATATLIFTTLVALRGKSSGRFAQLGATLGLTFLVVWVCSVNFPGDRSLWRFIFEYVPGGSAIRVPSRINHVLNILMVIITAIWIQRLAAHTVTRSFLVGCVAAVLITEQLNTAPSHMLSRQAEESAIARVAPVPQNCRVFYVSNVMPPDRLSAHIDAMLIARERNIPTLNGYSGWTPPGWTMTPFGPGYVARMHAWARNKGLSNVCSLDDTNGHWTLQSVMPPAYRLGEVIDFTEDGNGTDYQVDGWSVAEAGGTWMVGGRSRVLLDLETAPEGDAVLNLEAHAFTPPQRPELPISLSVDGRKIAEWVIASNENLIRRHVTLGRDITADQKVEIELSNHDPKSPADFGLSLDTRKIGLAMHKLSLTPVVYKLGMRLDFTATGDVSPFLAGGWADAEPGGRWTIGTESKLVFRFADDPKSDLVLNFEGHAFTPSQRPRFDVSVITDGRRAARWHISNSEQKVQRQLRIDKRLAADRLLEVVFVNHDPKSPADLKYSPDPRKLGLAVHAITITTADPQ